MSLPRPECPYCEFKTISEALLWVRCRLPACSCNARRGEFCVHCAPEAFPDGHPFPNACGADLGVLDD